MPSLAHNPSADPRDVAAELRRQAAVILDDARRRHGELVALADAIDAGATPEVPGDSLEAADAFIRRNATRYGGVSARQVARHVGLEESTVKSHLAPKLKARGFYSTRGATGGYHPPRPQ